MCGILLDIAFLFLDLGAHDIRMVLLVQSDIAVVLGITLEAVKSWCCTCCSPELGLLAAPEGERERPFLKMQMKRLP